MRMEMVFRGWARCMPRTVDSFLQTGCHVSYHAAIDAKEAVFIPYLFEINTGKICVYTKNQLLLVLFLQTNSTAESAERLDTS